MDPIAQPIAASGLSVSVETFASLPASGLEAPIARISTLREAPDGSDRIFVNDLRGSLWAIEDGGLTEFVDLSTNFSSFLAEPGLGTGFQSFAFHPDFAINGKFYTAHSETLMSLTDFPVVNDFYRATALQGVVTEWTMSDPSDLTWSGNQRELLRVDFPGHFHGLQEIGFNVGAAPGDPDFGMLYVAIGDGGQFKTGTGGDASHRLDSVLGTILRIDPEGSDAANGQYGIPTDNPFAADGDPNTLGEIYAWGFRNPHRFSFDAISGKTLVGDIGQDNIEEINLLEPGADYGWFLREGTFAVDSLDASIVYDLPANDAAFGYTYPVAQYDHDEGIAVAGGYVYRGSAIPELYGQYIFADLVTGRLFHVDADSLIQGQQAEIHELALLDGNQAVTSLKSLIGANRADVRLGEDADGELYLLTKTDGVVRKLVANGQPTPTLPAASGTPPAAEDYDTTSTLPNGGARLALTTAELALANFVIGGDGKDIIRTGGQNDYIAAGAGTDYSVYGGTGSDIFGFGVGDNIIRVRDFEDGVDQILLLGDLTPADLTIKNTGRNGQSRTDIQTQSGDRLILDGVSANQINNSDFFATSAPPPSANLAPTLSIFVPHNPFAENGTGAVLSVAVADANETRPGEALTLVLNGADADQFQLVYNAAGSYELFFKSVPDYEAPSDSDGDNNYRFNLTVTDPEGLFAQQYLDIDIADLPETTLPPIHPEPPILPTGFAAIVDGTSGKDQLNGSAGSDLIRGFEGKDRIDGKAGDDVIFAGPGQDYNVKGGAGRDVFVFGNQSSHLRVVDFEDNVDRILLADGIAFDALRIRDKSNGVILEFNDGSGTHARLTLLEANGTTLDPSDITLSDFVLVSQNELDDLLAL